MTRPAARLSISFYQRSQATPVRNSRLRLSVDGFHGAYCREGLRTLKERHKSGSKITFYSLWKAIHGDFLGDQDQILERKQRSMDKFNKLEQKLEEARKEIERLHENENKFNEELINQQAEKRTVVLYEAFEKKKLKKKELKKKLAEANEELEEQRTQINQFKGDLMEIKELKEEIERVYYEMTISLSEEKGKVKALEDRAAKFRTTLHKLKKQFLAVHNDLESIIRLSLHREVMEKVLSPQTKGLCLEKPNSMMETLAILSIGFNELVREKGGLMLEWQATQSNKKRGVEKDFQGFVESRITETLKHFSAYLTQAAQSYEEEKNKLLESIGEILNILLNYKKLFTL